MGQKIPRTEQKTTTGEQKGLRTSKADNHNGGSGQTEDHHNGAGSRPPLQEALQIVGELQRPLHSGSLDLDVLRPSDSGPWALNFAEAVELESADTSGLTFNAACVYIIGWSKTFDAGAKCFLQHNQQWCMQGFLSCATMGEDPGMAAVMAKDSDVAAVTGQDAGVTLLEANLCLPKPN